MISRDEFLRHVKGALNNFYDPIHLQTHPLVGTLKVQAEPGATKGEALRKLLRETIELLKPNASIPIGRPEWDGYRVLWLHYVRSLSQTETCVELNISEASFFRRQREALDAVVSILWERYQKANPPENDDDTETLGFSSPEQAMRRSITLVREGTEELVDLRELLDSVLKTVQPLAQQRGVAVRIDVPSSLSLARGDPPILRQIFLNLLAEGMQFASGNGLELAVSMRDEEMIWRLRGLADLDPGQDLESQGGFPVTRNLLRLCEGRVWLERDRQGGPTLLLVVPVAKSRSILVIDDDPRAIDLYRRYLQNHDYVLVGARTAEQARALFAETCPDLVLLDVLMPQRDGWTVLEYLKETPQTANIPVVVCSVISQPQLALALGAAEVLNKPFTPEELARTIEMCLSRANSEEKARRARLSSN